MTSKYQEKLKNRLVQPDIADSTLCTINAKISFYTKYMQEFSYELKKLQVQKIRL